MKILCVEDLYDKFKHIQRALIGCEVEITWKANCQDGIIELKNNTYDYLLLDMSMPICDDSKIKDNFDAFAGMLILREIKRKKYQIKVIVITGFDDFERQEEILTLDELIDKIKVKYADYYVGVVKYDSASMEWQDNLKGYLGFI